MENKNVKKLTFLKIISAIICVATFIYLLVGLINATGGNSSNPGLELAVYLTFSVIIFGVIGNAIAVILAVIGLIHTLINREKGQCNSQVITFIVLTVLPILSQAFFILYCVLY